jgi:hypothetical protein
VVATGVALVNESPQLEQNRAPDATGDPQFGQGDCWSGSFTAEEIGRGERVRRAVARGERRVQGHPESGGDACEESSRP